MIDYTNAENIHRSADVLAGVFCFHVVSNKSKVEATDPSETSVIMYEYKRCHSPQHFTVHKQVCENPKSCMLLRIMVISLCGIYKYIILGIPYCRKYTLGGSSLRDISVFVSDPILK